MKKNLTPRHTDLLTILFNDLRSGSGGGMTVEEIRRALTEKETLTTGKAAISITPNNVIRLLSAIRNFYRSNKEQIIETRSYGNVKRYQLCSKHMVTRSDTSQLILELMKEARISKIINRSAFLEKVAAMEEFKKRKLSKAALELRLNWAIKEGYIREGQEKNQILLGDRAFAELLYLEATAFGKK